MNGRKGAAPHHSEERGWSAWVAGILLSCDCCLLDAPAVHRSLVLKVQFYSLYTTTCSAAHSRICDTLHIAWRVTTWLPLWSRSGYSVHMKYSHPLGVFMWSAWQLSAQGLSVGDLLQNCHHRVCRNGCYTVKPPRDHNGSGTHIFQNASCSIGLTESEFSKGWEFATWLRSHTLLYHNSSEYTNFFQVLVFWDPDWHWQMRQLGLSHNFHDCSPATGHRSAPTLSRLCLSSYLSCFQP